MWAWWGRGSFLKSAGGYGPAQLAEDDLKLLNSMPLQPGGY